MIAEHLENAGFVEYEIEAIEFPMRYASVQEWWETTRAMSRFAAPGAHRRRGGVARRALRAAAVTAPTAAGDPGRTWVARTAYASPAAHVGSSAATA